MSISEYTVLANETSVEQKSSPGDFQEKTSHEQQSPGTYEPGGD
jgi:hypothetical protein